MHDLTFNVNHLLEVCNYYSKKYHRRAVIYKWSSNTLNMLVILFSLSSGLTSWLEENNAAYIPVIFSFTVAVTQSCLSYYSLDQKASKHERISVELLQLARKFRQVDPSDENKVKKLTNQAYRLIDKFRLEQFKIKESV